MLLRDMRCSGGAWLTLRQHLRLHREAIKQQIRFSKQESLATTRNAIRTARETEETASNTLGKLGEQTGEPAQTGAKSVQAYDSAR